MSERSELCAVPSAREERREPAGAARRIASRPVLSLGYFSLHEQREVTRSCEAGVKALLQAPAFMLCLWISRLSAGHGSLGRRSGRPWGAQAMAEAESGAFAPLRGASHLPCSCKETWPEGGAFQQPNGWSIRPCLSAFRTSGTPGPLRRRDFSTRPSCDAAGAGAVASRRQPAHRGEAVLRLFPVRPCLVEKRRDHPLRSRVRGRRPAARHLPVRRGEAVLRLFPPNPCTSPLRGLVRRLRRCGRGPGSQMQRRKQNHGNANNNRRPADVPKEEEPLARPFPLHRATCPIRPDRPRPPAAPPSSVPPTGGTRTRPAPVRRR